MLNLNNADAARNNWQLIADSFKGENSSSMSKAPPSISLTAMNQ